MFFRVIAFFFVIFSLVFCAIALKLDVENVSDSINGGYLNGNNHDVESAFPQRKWISQLFHQAQSEFRMDFNVNTECKRDFDLFQLHLQNQSVWAVKMLESSEWPLVGILSGTVDRFGSYDECLTISSYNIKGQYCLTEVKYDYPDTLEHEIEEVPDGKISAWEVLSMYQKNPIRAERNKLRFAICIPSTCKPDDLKISLNSTLTPIFRSQRLNITVNVNPEFCKTRNEIIYPKEFHIVRYSLLGLFLFVIFCTFYDIYGPTEDETKYKGNPRGNSMRGIFQSFSIPQNFQKLTKINPEIDYAKLDFPKICNMVAMIYSHRLAHSFNYPLYNTEVAERYYMGYTFDFTHQYVMVDAFFAVSGFLQFHFGLSPTMRNGKMYVISNIMLRWIRRKIMGPLREPSLKNTVLNFLGAIMVTFTVIMIPVFCVVKLFIVHVLPYIGDGPMWNHIMTREIANCKESWWTNFFAINNIIKPDKQCLFIAWYMAVDMQLTILGGILLYIFVKNKKLGVFAVLFTFVVSIVITFIVAYLNHYDGLIKFTLRKFENMREYEEFWNFYVATYPRCGPYLMGFMAAYVVKILLEKKFKFTYVQANFLLLVSLIVTEMNQIYGGAFYAFNRPYDRFENALYAALNRSMSMVLYFVSFILYFTSGSGVLDRLASAKIWIPLGRLSYSVFLVNCLIQTFHISCQKQPLMLPTRINMLWWTVGDITLSYTLGLLLHLFVEAPIMNLRTLVKRYLFSRVSKVETQANGNSQTISKDARRKSKNLEFGRSNVNVKLE